jgi:hypothetical protein
VDVTVELYRGAGTSAPIRGLVTTVDEDGGFSATGPRLEPGVYTAEAKLATQGAAARVTFLLWQLGRVTDNSSVAPGRLEGVSLVATRDGATAAAFDDDDDRIVVLSSEATSATRSVSLGAWVKHDGAGRWQNILAKPGTGGEAEQNYALWITPENRVVALFGGGSDHVRADTRDALDGAWHQLAASYDGEAARIYVDGVLAAEKRGEAQLAPNGLPLLIGRGGESEDRRSFDGLLADVWVSAAPLDSGPARRLYAREVTQFRSTTPTVTLTSPENGSRTTDTTPAFAGSASRGALDRQEVEVRLYRGRSLSTAPLQTLVAHRVAAGAWSVSARSRMRPGTYTARATQAGVAGDLGASEPTTFTVLPSFPSSGPVLAGAGDIADCTDSGHEATAELLTDVPEATVQTFGDNAYPRGSPSDFATCYDSSWGQVKGRTNPAIGDHEYDTRRAAGYFGYFADRLARFGTSARDPARAYYSYELGSWHVAVLNASCWKVPTCNVERQLAWLDDDLAQREGMCTLAVLHSPRWSSGAVHGDNRQMQPYWERLYEYGADIVVGGDEHVYERYAPQNPQGTYDPRRGLRQFTVGTGGGSLYDFARANPNSEVRHGGSYGILKLALHPRGYEWQFVAARRKTVVDGGSDRCH